MVDSELVNNIAPTKPLGFHHFSQRALTPIPDELDGLGARSEQSPERTSGRERGEVYLPSIRTGRAMRNPTALIRVEISNRGSRPAGLTRLLKKQSRIELENHNPIHPDALKKVRRLSDSQLA